MPRHQRYWVGLDAGHLETAVCLVDAEGHAFFEAMTETRAAPIRDILRRFGVEPVQTVTIEAGVTALCYWPSFWTGFSRNTKLRVSLYLSILKGVYPRER